ncbi:LysR family transcriptional regulator [Robbsia andropogonis]|uniref:LysR family transcriptional regulator n=1 Tax=Robbsia andropogonis TaxID=28092 RepID=UPI00069697F6|nr:LysR substrate-binding domain-containing protein [Robbsia andropogonis]
MEGLTITRLRYLFEAVRLGGIRAAADHLDVAPSAVSRQLAILERAVRSPLLEKNRRGAKPTEAGALLIEHYRAHLAREEVLVSKLEGIHGLEYGTVSIGAIQGFTEDLMSRALRVFHQRYPKVSITLELGGVSDIQQWLEEDRVHLGLTYGPPFDSHAMRFKEITAADQPVCAIVRGDHPLALRSRVTIRDLLDYPFALARRGYGTRDIVERIELSGDLGTSGASGASASASTTASKATSGLPPSFASDVSAAAMSLRETAPAPRSDARFSSAPTPVPASTPMSRLFNVLLETDHLIGLAGFVRAGMGVTLLPAFAVGDDIERGTLVAVEIDHPLMRNVQARVISRRGRELPLAAVALQRLLIEQMRAFHPGAMRAQTT